MGHDGLSNLYTMPITGGSPKQLTFLNSSSLGGVWSPDGERIAFASTEGGRPRVWTVPAGGGMPHALSTSDVSDTFDLAWSPAPRILYQQAGNRNYQEIDPATREARLLVRDGRRVGYFRRRLRPTAGRSRVFWNRPPNRGIWVIEVNGRQERMVYRSTALSSTPIGWSADGRAIYVVEGKPSTFRGRAETVTNAKIVTVPSNGGPVQTVAALEFDDIGSVSMTPDGRRFVFPVYSTLSDAWVVDHFDAARGPRIVRAQ